MARRRRSDPVERLSSFMGMVFPQPARGRWLWWYRCEWIEEDTGIVRGEQLYSTVETSNTNYQRASYHARQLAARDPPACVARMMSGRRPLRLRLQCRRIGDVEQVP